MEFYEKAREQMLKLNMTYDSLRLVCCSTFTAIRDVLEGKREPTALQAEKICRALHFEWDLRHFRGYKSKVKKKDTLAEDAKAASALGLNYGTYCAYRDTGYLATYIVMQEKAAKNTERVNIIPSNIIGATRSRTAPSVEVRKF